MVEQRNRDRGTVEQGGLSGRTSDGGISRTVEQ